MEFILEKLLEKIITESNGSYSPEQIKQILDSHQEAILILAKNLSIVSLIISAIIIFLVIRMEFKFSKFEKILKNLKKNSWKIKK